MATITEHHTRVLPRPRLGSPWLRTRVWLTRHSLDHRLAQGESMLDSPELTRRAQQLGSVRRRHTLAAGLRRVIEDAERPARVISAAAPIQRRAILHARTQLERLAAEVGGHDPVRLEGIARVQILLTDGTSPLFMALPEGALDDAVARAQAALSLD